MATVVRRVNDAYMIEGHLDDLVDFTQMSQGPFPLKIRFGNVHSVNSVGTRSFLRFVQAHRSRGVEFHELSEAMVDLINCIPGILGNPADPSIVKSLFIGWRCHACSRDESSLLPVDARRGVPKVPPHFCARCKGLMATVMPLEDYFIFIGAGD